MYDHLVGCPKGKGCFPRLVKVRVNSKKVIVVFLMVIMEDFDDFFGFGGRFSIILRISSGAAKEEPEDEDGSVTRYTHKGGGTIVVLMAGDFLET